MTDDKKNLSAEEQEILDSYDAGEWQPVEDRDAEMERFRKYARATFKKDKRVNIRISEKDLEALQKKGPGRGDPLPDADGERPAQIRERSPVRTPVV